MWNGPGQGPRGRPPFRGNHHGEMFGGRDHPMPGFWGRDGMNMGPMGHTGPLDLPPMAIRRMEGPPMWGRDMDPRDMRGREQDRDCFRSGPGPVLNYRGRFDGHPRGNLMNSPRFSGVNMGGRDVPTWEQNNRYMDMRDRDMFRDNMPRFNNPNMDGMRVFPMNRMELNNNFGEIRPPVGIDDDSNFNMEIPQQERRMIDIDRRAGPPFNPRGGFDSDMDFRTHPDPPPDVRGRERSPLRFGNDAPPMDRTRAGMPADDSGSQRSDFKGPEEQSRRSEGPESSGSPLMDYRSGEEMTLAEEWKSRQKDKPAVSDKGREGASEASYPASFRRDVTSRDPPAFVERDRPPVDFPGKNVRFPRGDHFAEMDRPPLGRNSPQERTPLPATPGRENESKCWLAERDSEPSQNKSKHGEKYHKDLSTHETVEPNDGFKGLKDIPHSEGQTRGKMPELEEFQSRDQDYRDIDYRTASGRMFEYKQGALQGTPLIEESKPAVPPQFSASGSKDQDYRSASVEGKVSTTLSIIGIPKSATMEQVLDAFTVQDGMPQPGMKIKNVVPGYSYDTAYVEFLNLEDAVHFMESNKGSLKIGTRTVSISYSHPDDHKGSVDESHRTLPPPPESQLSRPDRPTEEFESDRNGSTPKGSEEPLWQRNSDLTPEAWQQQVDQQVDQQFHQQESETQAESWGHQNNPHHNSHQSKSVFKDSKTMIIKNIKPTTTIEAILKALDPFAYLDERNVRLIKAKTPGAKCFCFVDMDSHEQVTRLVDLLLTKPNPLYIDGVRVYAEVAKPLKNPSFRREFDKPNSSTPGYQPAASTMEQQQQFYPKPQPLMQPPPGMQADLPTDSSNPPLSVDARTSQGIGYDASQAVEPSCQATEAQEPAAAANQSYDADTQDTSSYLYDATSGFYYDPETTLYYDPGSRYFYNAQNQEYLYWDTATKAYVPVPGGNQGHQSVVMTPEDQAILSNPAADAPLDMKRPSEPPLPTTQAAVSADNRETPSPEKKDDDDSPRRDEKPKSLAAVKIMKDMERWAKIQNRQKECVRSLSPVLRGGMDDDRKQSKTADAGFAVFERKNSGSEDLFKKPLAPAKKDEKPKRPMGSLGMLASDYAAGSDEEVEEEKEEVVHSGQVGKAPSEDREDKLTDWKKMACLLCRRQFPNKDALIRHQQLSDLHKQNMEIHLKIKRSKKELEALENQEKELSTKEVGRSPEQKRRKHHHQQPQQQHNSWAGGSREIHKVSDRPGLGSEPPPRRQKKEHVAWDHATYKQAVRKAMFARFKELE
ncbi:RNA-binding protein 6 isoform X2 [Phyllopteryx taeniolatus]|uniref:RNA-binding protein 6 isoform X2 n=1 Tax=Phyllopteryx taeniolatus TaxID=161469 RepID=UPI002AD44B90|nr:RNA-binding protein 6 isoform X2 [Phyllopteryx taeniolatus]